MDSDSSSIILVRESYNLLDFPISYKSGILFLSIHIVHWFYGLGVIAAWHPIDGRAVIGHHHEGHESNIFVCTYSILRPPSDFSCLMNTCLFLVGIDKLTRAIKKRTADSALWYKFNTYIYLYKM